MKRSYLSKVLGSGAIAAGLTVLSLAVPTAARSADMNDYQILRHEARTMSDLPANNMMAQNTQNMQNQNMMQAISDQYYTAREMYQMGRHEWRGEGLMTGLRNSGSAMMMRQGSMMSPSTSGGTSGGSMMSPSRSGGTSGGSMMSPSRSGGSTTQPGTVTIPVTPSDSTPQSTDGTTTPNAPSSGVDGTGAGTITTPNP